MRDRSTGWRASAMKDLSAKLPGFAEQFEGELLRDVSGYAEQSLHVHRGACRKTTQNRHACYREAC